MSDSVSTEPAHDQPEASLPALLHAVAPPKPWLVIEGGKSKLHLDLIDLWRFRDLLFTLATRDLKLRYKQTALGIIWVVLQPMMAAGIFTIVFGLIAGLKPTGGVPYFIFSFASMTAWTLFSGTLVKVSGCLVGNSQLISKVYFPRLVLPLSVVGSVLVDFAISMAMLAVLLAVFGVAPGWPILLLPVWILLLLVMALGLGLVTSSLAVSYRDINYILPVFVQMLLYATPVVFALSELPRSVDRWKWFFYINPMTGLLEGFRWSVFGAGRPDAALITISTVSAVALAALGLYCFKSMERKFADVV